jgi:hypothetical protein
MTVGVRVAREMIEADEYEEVVGIKPGTRGRSSGP